MVPRIYIDTSVIGGCFDIEFQKWSNMLMEEFRLGQKIAVVSDITYDELATVNRVDILVSWNFKHIVNIDRIRKYNSVNIKNGYPPLEIRNPREILKPFQNE